MQAHLADRDLLEEGEEVVLLTCGTVAGVVNVYVYVCREVHPKRAFSSPWLLKGERSVASS